MKLAVNFLQAGLVHVRINLRRGDAGVAEHLLNLPQVGAAGEQMRRKAMPDRVWAGIRRRPGAGRVALD